MIIYVAPNTNSCGAEGPSSSPPCSHKSLWHLRILWCEQVTVNKHDLSSRQDFGNGGGGDRGFSPNRWQVSAIRDGPQIGGGGGKQHLMI